MDSQIGLSIYDGAFQNADINFYMKSPKLTLNVLPLKLTEQKKQFSFYSENSENEDLSPLQPHELPGYLQNSVQETLYTSFESDEKADYNITISFNESHDFAKQYMNHKIYRWFCGRSRLISRDFVKNTILYYKKETDKRYHIARFDRYKIRAGYGRFTDGFELTIMYRGVMSAWMKPVYEYPGSSEDFRWVIYKGEVVKYEKIMEQEGADRNEIFPVINRDVARTLELPKNYYKAENKLKRHSEHIDRFYEKFICDEDFTGEFKPDPDGFLRIEDKEHQKLNPDAANLLFGGGVTKRDPFYGMLEGGPYKPPAVSHIELLFIFAESDRKKTANRLYKAFKKGSGSFRGLNSFARIPVHHSKDYITFSNTENPLPEIREQLRQLPRKEGVTYGAIYISPISRDDPDRDRHRVYYRVKEELLKYDITSQVIDRTSVYDPSFSYYLPNISVALIAKLNGIPWTLQKKKRKELVIGIGAFRPAGRRKTYLGSAFCFSNSGDFRGFDSFTADDTLKLAGSFQKAIKRFRDENNEIERVNLHFYKKINRRESRILMDSLRELNLDIPMVILTIHKSGSKDLVLTDRSADHYLPVSGTWMRSGSRQFLLCNNSRYNIGTEKIKSFPYPVKIYADEAGSHVPEDYSEYKQWLEDRLSDDEYAEELMLQVYQFSRLNWQTVSVKSLPVTVRYPEMVAKKFPFFDGDVIPEFGKQNFWFL